MTLDSTSLVEGLAPGLLGRAVHASGTRSLDGMAELTFYDTLVAIAAAEGARRRQAWLIEREVRPPGWKGAERVDLVVSRVKGRNEVWVIAAELKWWRQHDPKNSSNRRRDLAVDFLRAAAVAGVLKPEDGAYVALVTTEAAWTNTTTVKKGKDGIVCRKLLSQGKESWSLRSMKDAPAIKGAVGQLRASVPLTSSFETRFLREVSAPIGGADGPLRVRVWRVRKPQKSTLLTGKRLIAAFGKAKKEEKEDADTSIAADLAATTLPNRGDGAGDIAAARPVGSSASVPPPAAIEPGEADDTGCPSGAVSKSA